MSNPFAAAAEAAARASPMSVGGVHKNRTLLIDGDSLAYFCAGGDDMPAGQARRTLSEKVANATARAGASTTLLLLTSSASTKGGRYAVARVKPYQGNRKSGRKPKNWAFLREVLESNAVPGAVVRMTDTLEADDLFAIASRTAHAKGYEVVLHYDDKDMRMIPGIHMTWRDLYLHTVPPGTYASTFDDKLYGTAWFWHQMLHGDDADNIPGLPWREARDGKRSRCGPKTAKALLAECENDGQAMAVVAWEYAKLYKDRARVELLEQGILLWMRGSPDPFDVVYNGPLRGLADHKDWPQVRAEIEERLHAQT